jgi:tetratricopeptide (TPR) repeat protein
MLCNALRSFLDFSGRWDRWQSLSRQAEEKAAADEDFYHAGWRAYDWGWISFLRGQPDDVLASAARSAAHWAKGPQAGTHEKATALWLRGLGHKLREDLPLAIEAMKEALDLRAIAPESASVATTLNSLAEVERQQGDHAAAERDHREASEFTGLSTTGTALPSSSAIWLSWHSTAKSGRLRKRRRARHWLCLRSWGVRS